MKFVKKIVDRNDRVRQLTSVISALHLEQDVERCFRQMVLVPYYRVDRVMLRAMEAVITTAALGQYISAMRIDLRATLKGLAGSIAITQANKDVREAEPTEGRGWVPPIHCGNLIADGHYLGAETCLYVSVDKPEYKLVPPVDPVKVLHARWTFERNLAASIGALRQGGGKEIHDLTVSVDPRYEDDFTSIFIVEGTNDLP